MAPMKKPAASNATSWILIFMLHFPQPNRDARDAA
jgi:hypothetical protein